MRTYYFYTGKKVKGPYKISKLEKFNINESTPIYHYDLPEWTTAEYVPELKPLTDKYIQPPVINYNNNRLTAGIVIVSFFLLGIILLTLI